MATAGSSDEPTRPGDDEYDLTLPSDPRDYVRRRFLLDPDLDRLLRAEALRRKTTEAAILRALLRRHFNLP